MVASSGHRRSEPQFENYAYTSTDPDTTAYTPFGAYSQSRTANIYKANEIDRRYSRQGLHGLSLHLGGIKSNLQKHMSAEMRKKMGEDPEMQRWSKGSAQGTASQVYTAVSEEWEGKGGIYLEDCDESPEAEQWKVSGGKDGNKGHKAYIYDAEKAARLWKDSLELVGLLAEETTASL